MPVLVAGGLFISACADSAGTAGETSSTVLDGENDRAVGTNGGAADLPPLLELSVPDPNSIYDPIRGGEQPPDGYRQLLVRDAIEPVYDPIFTLADQVDWPEDSLVIGVDLNDEARAYPVGFLNRREIVNDNHRGIPTLVTW